MPESPGLYLRLTVTENLDASPGSTSWTTFAGASNGRCGRSTLKTVRAIRAARCQRVCASASRWRERCSTTPPCCSSTSRRLALTRWPAREVHGLIASLRERGVTIFLTTHRLEEAERLCHRVAILNTTLRMIGRPDELREQLFSRSLDVRVRAPLQDPDAVLGGLPGRRRLGDEAPSGYALAVSDPEVAAPQVARALVSAGADILSIGESRHSLEDVYLELIDEDVEASRR